MSRVTPFFCITVSSSFCTSSRVKPYWKPEQPPPETNTRSLSSVLPSSSINCFTLPAALSEKTSGAGISVTAFMCAPLPDISTRLVAARGELQLDPFRLDPALMHQASFHDRSLLDLEVLVMHIPFDARTDLEFKRLGRVHRGVDGVVQ